MSEDGKLLGFQQKIINEIEGDPGWSGISVFATPDEPIIPFTYSIGFWRNHQQPEVIIFGLDSRNAHGLLWTVWDKISEGWEIPIGEPVEGMLQEGYPVIFESVVPDRVDDYFGAALGYYDHHFFPAVQLVWPDKEKNFPWDEGWDEEMSKHQPLIGRVE